jgi:hypothetical protein
VAFDEGAVWFSENAAVGNSALHVVQKTGGAKITINREISVEDLVVLPTELLAWGITREVDSAIFAIRKDGRGVRTLVDDERIRSGPRVFDGVVYFLKSTFAGPNTLWSVPVSGGTPTLLHDDVSIFLRDLDVDECAITFGTNRGTLERLKR